MRTVGTLPIMQFSPELLNEKIAPGIADFDAAAIPDLRQEFDQFSYWLSNHHLNSLFGPAYNNNWKQWSINLLFRAQSQFNFYHQALDATKVFFSMSSYQNPAVGAYFNAISLWESSFLNFQIFVDLYNKATSVRAFEKDNGSEEQRAHAIANRIKHWGSDLKSTEHDPHHTIPMWLSNSGFHSIKDNHLTYGEFASITKEIARTANVLENPNLP